MSLFLAHAEMERRFGGQREATIQRDGEKCVRCGITRAEHLEKYGKDLTVDHIDNHGRNSATKNHDPENLQTLCTACHGKKDGGLWKKTYRGVYYTCYFDKSNNRWRVYINHKYKRSFADEQSARKFLDEQASAVLGGVL